MKKRILSLGLAVMMAASLTACGGSKTETSAAAEKTEDSKAADTKAEDTSAAAEGDTTAAAEGETAAPAEGEAFVIGGIGPITGAAAAYGNALA